VGGGSFFRGCASARARAREGAAARARSRAVLGTQHPRLPSAQDALPASPATHASRARMLGGCCQKYRSASLSLLLSRRKRGLFRKEGRCCCCCCCCCVCVCRVCVCVCVCDIEERERGRGAYVCASVGRRRWRRRFAAASGGEGRRRRAAAASREESRESPSFIPPKNVAILARVRVCVCLVWIE
jgi:hypothetical protein